MMLLITLLCTAQAWAQYERRYIRQGNELYAEGKYDESMAKYYEALDKNSKMTEGVFNIGDTHYEQENYEQAIRQFEMAAQLAEDPNTKAQAYHNLGNALLKSQKLPESIESYKNALRHNPNDLDTKHNLLYAQRLQKQQQQQQQNQQNQEQQKDKEQQQQQQDKKDQQNQQQRQQEKKEEQEQQAQREKQKEEQAQQQQQPRPQQLSKEEAERLLEALMQEEKNVQEKLQRLKAKPGQRKNIEKDW